MRRVRRLYALAALCVVLIGCQSPNRADRMADGQALTGAPLLEGMGSHTRDVQTADPLAQRYFNQGLTLAYAFNHDEAIRSFEAAAQIDPTCAMAWWGVALCHGPHINNPAMPAERGRAAWAAIEKAVALRDNASPVNRALIDALTKRYASPPPEDRRHLDLAYAEAMADVYAAYATDTDVGTLYAESLMDLQPWDLWQEDGAPKGNTIRIMALLQSALARQPGHPGANHLYIHVVESSTQPERGIAAADRLRDLVPGAGHLVHMPSHIDVLTGRWALASDQNEKAIEADRRYREQAPRQGFYHVYMAHNHHMLAFAAMMEGRHDVAVRAARDLVAGVPEDYARENVVLVDPYLMVVSEVQMRFGRWDDILQQPKPADYLPISNALWHFTRGVAYAAKQQFDKAEAERAAFIEARANVPEGAVMAINSADLVLSIAERVLDGEIAYQRGNIDDAVRSLREAVKLEDQLLYMEPPEWILPVRHVLGAVLLDAGRYSEAEIVYRENLKEWPENGWALFGLSRALAQLGSSEADEVEQRFRKAWARSDTRIHASCLCMKKQQG